MFVPNYFSPEDAPMRVSFPRLLSPEAGPTTTTPRT